MKTFKDKEAACGLGNAEKSTKMLKSRWKAV